MKIRLLAVFLLSAILISCQETSEKDTTKKQEKKTVPTDSVQVIRGEYIYVDSSAVLKGKTFIYGVKLDSLSVALGEKVNSMKKSPYEMIPVKIKGIIKKNENISGWSKIVEIKEVLKVMEPKPKKAIQIKTKKDSKEEE